MLDKIEEEHQTKLQQLDSLKVQQDSFFQNKEVISINSGFNLNSNLPEEQNMNSIKLTLDDKERITFQQEQLRRLNNEGPLLPESRPIESHSSASHQQPKDLTSILINANLGVLPTSKSVAANMSSANTFKGLQFGNASQSFPTLNAEQNPLTNKPNLSAFDSLVISDLSHKNSPQSLNAMKQTNTNTSLNTSRPMANNFNVSNTNQVNLMGSLYSSNLQTQPAKQLSKTELEEFLN